MVDHSEHLIGNEERNDNSQSEPTAETRSLLDMHVVAAAGNATRNTGAHFESRKGKGVSGCPRLIIGRQEMLSDVEVEEPQIVHQSPVVQQI